MYILRTVQLSSTAAYSCAQLYAAGYRELLVQEVYLVRGEENQSLRISTPWTVQLSSMRLINLKTVPHT